LNIGVSIHFLSPSLPFRFAAILSLLFSLLEKSEGLYQFIVLGVAYDILVVTLDFIASLIQLEISKAKEEKKTEI